MSTLLKKPRMKKKHLAARANNNPYPMREAGAT
jgi:hypothetical protein